RTQFLTMAQGMPKAVEDELQKLIMKFMWTEGGHHFVSQQLLMAPVTHGGVALLDLSARNRAIDLMWIKTYLNLQRSRPRWTFLADALFAGAPTLASKRVARSVRVNPFLQQWDVSVRPMRPLPAPLRTMISTATRFNTSLSPLLPDEALRLALPIWYHIGMRGGRAAANSAAGRCLRERHLVKTV
ncbi:hypothetical protein C2E23DRAFT_711260, partial [Lenzites betulinus]